MSGHAEPVGIAAELSAAGRRLRGAMAFAAPLLVLFLAWPVLVAAFDVNPRVFPGVPAVVAAAMEGVRDGSLLAHVAASLGRVLVGTTLAVLVAVPLGIAMGVNAASRRSSPPLFRFFSVLAGIAWIPIATLWFGYGFGAITFVIFNAGLLHRHLQHASGVSSIPPRLRHAAASLGAGRIAMVTEVLPPGALPNIVHRHPHGPRASHGAGSSRRDDRDERGSSATCSSSPATSIAPR
jgi:NitT/TauT family transport system permease protein/taurine transport system permease protein